MRDKLTKLEKDWILYDVGNSAFILISATIVPIFFKNIATDAGISNAMSTAYWSYTLSISTLILAVLGPILGRMADEKGRKKYFFLFCLAVGVIGCAVLGLINHWLAFLLVFLIAKSGYSGSLIFYDAMLTDVTTNNRSDRVSASGYAWGYIGSCIPFILCLALILKGDKVGIDASLGTIVSFMLIALWWILCTIPLLRNYKQVYYREKLERHSFKTIVSGFKRSIEKVKQNRAIWTFMLAYFFYIDGVFTIIEMATSYGKDVGIGDTDLLLALLLTQIIAFPFALLFGYLSKKIKTRKLIEFSIIGYILIVLFALQLDQAWEFWFLAVCVAVFQGGIQSLSRSYFSRLVPKENSNEFFGMFDIFGKGAAFTGTLLIGVVTQITGSTRIGVAALIVLLGIGFYFVKKMPKNAADL
ncbi:MAG: MFS transporter [Erysipelotrichaceae bacterium]|nr:MFS transporter [Erysipelotrichaceae bacterium]